VAWEPPRADDQPTIAWQPATPPAAPVAPASPAGPILSASPTGVAPPAAPAGATPAVSGWVMPNAGLPLAPVAGYVIAGVGSRLIAFFLDGILQALLVFVALIGITIAAGTALTDDPVASAALSGIVFTGVEFLYYVGFWTSGRRATPGMRALDLGIVTPGGGRIGVTSAVVRWFLLTVPLVNFIGLLPQGGDVAAWVILLWPIALLVTTAISPSRQGLHDRWAGTIVVRRAGASNSGAVIGCLAIIALLVLATLVGLIYLGSQMETILSEVGESI
jgi:uncharacterized RDD family membrane protein YckC